MEQRIVARGPARIGYLATGEGPAVLLLASLGRGAEDFAEVAPLVAAAGFRVLCPDPRGIGALGGPMEGLTLYDLAEDAAAVLEAEATGPAIIGGHAFGNWVARALSAARPDAGPRCRAAGRLRHHQPRSGGPRLDRRQLRPGAVRGGAARASAARLFRAGA